MRALSLHWNVVALWQAVLSDQPPFAATRSDTATTWLVWRKQEDLNNYFIELNEMESYVYTALKSDHPFSALCDGLLNWYPEEIEATQFIVQLLQHWIAEQLLEGSA